VKEDYELDRALKKLETLFYALYISESFYLLLQLAMFSFIYYFIYK